MPNSAALCFLDKLSIFDKPCYRILQLTYFPLRTYTQLEKPYNLAKLTQFGEYAESNSLNLDVKLKLKLPTILFLVLSPDLAPAMDYKLLSA